MHGLTKEPWAHARTMCAPSFTPPLRGSVALDAAFMSRVTELGNRNCVTHDRSYRLLGVDEEAPGASHGASPLSSAHARVSTRPGTAQCGARILTRRACGPALLPADALRAASAGGSVDRAAAGLAPPRVDTRPRSRKDGRFVRIANPDFGKLYPYCNCTALVLA